MSFFARRAEERIREAMERGEFEGLPGSGKPLPPDPSQNVPEELRIAYKLLRDAGYLPPELELKKEIVSLRELLASVTDEDERYAIARRLNERVLRLNLSFRRTLALEERQVYARKIRRKLGRR